MEVQIDKSWEENHDHDHNLLISTLFLRIHQYLHRNLHHNTILSSIPCPQHLLKPEYQLRDLLHSCKQQGNSSSIFVFGGSGSGRDQVVERAIYSIFSKETKVARVSNLFSENDEDAIFSIAEQLCVRNDRIFSSALQDITTQMKNARSHVNSTPVVIIIDEIQQYAKARKQILIYTLLDLMHNPDLLFVMIGLTSNAFIGNVFEKRIISRLNAQYIFVPRPTADDILLDLYHRLVLPEDIKSLDHGIFDDLSTFPSSLIQTYQSFREEFNQTLTATFGSLIVTYTAGHNTNDDDHGDDAAMNDDRIQTIGMNGSLKPMIETKLAYGFSLKEFYSVCISAIHSLPWITQGRPIATNPSSIDLHTKHSNSSYTTTNTDSNNSTNHNHTHCWRNLHITQTVMMSSLKASDPISLCELLQSLPILELQLLATITHLELRSYRNLDTVSSTSSSSVSHIPHSHHTHHSYSHTSSYKNIQEITRVYDRLTNYSIKDHEVIMQLIISLERKSMITIISPSDSSKNYTDFDVIRLCHPPQLIQQVFVAQEEDKKVIIGQRFRDAVVNPLTPIVATRLNDISNTNNNTNRDSSLSSQSRKDNTRQLPMEISIAYES